MFRIHPGILICNKLVEATVLERVRQLSYLVCDHDIITEGCQSRVTRPLAHSYAPRVQERKGLATRDYALKKGGGTG